MSGWAGAVDRLIEASVVGSFSRIGPALRSRMHHWQNLEGLDLSGRTYVVTGATSGLGLGLAQWLARCRATVVILARDEAKARATCDRIGGESAKTPAFVRAEMGDLSSVRAAAAEILRRWPRLDGLVHNAGALDDSRSESPQGIEQTVACHVVGPYLLTDLLRPALARGAPSRVVWVSSGGMYAEPLDVATLQMPAEAYDGVKAYAKAKRAQVALAEVLAGRLRGEGISVHAMHPGWVDTPGVARSLPRFRQLTRPLLRDTWQGIDTVAWLLVDAEPLGHPGRFWLDRARRSPHRLAATQRADTPAERDRLVAWIEAKLAAVG